MRKFCFFGFTVFFVFHGPPAFGTSFPQLDVILPKSFPCLVEREFIGGLFGKSLKRHLPPWLSLPFKVFGGVHGRDIPMRETVFSSFLSPPENPFRFRFRENVLFFASSNHKSRRVLFFFVRLESFPAAISAFSPPIWLASPFLSSDHGRFFPPFRLLSSGPPFKWYKLGACL